MRTLKAPQTKQQFLLARSLRRPKSLDKILGSKSAKEEERGLELIKDSMKLKWV